MNISDLIVEQKSFLTDQLGEGLMQLSQACDNYLDAGQDIEQLNELLLSYMQNHSYANLVYVLDESGVQMSANITKSEISDDFQGQNLSDRPFFNAIDDEHPIYISDAYISSATLKPCISVVHTICRDEKIMGMLVFDLDLEKLPLPKQDFNHEDWRQIKGDPEIRSNLFNQQRIESAMDKSLDTVHDIAIELLAELGVFHLKLHYPASRATVWSLDDPYNYHVHVLDEIINPNILLLYPKKDYPKNAKVSQDQIKTVFEKFKYLRFMDENLYLKTASLNIMNGSIGLNFSCDGSHYLSIDDFLDNFDEKFG